MAWTAPPWSERSKLMWIGLGDERGRSWCGISPEVQIDRSTNDFIPGGFRLIAPDEPRMSRPQRAAAVVGFCGDVGEFWAWVPTAESFAKWFELGDDTPKVFDRCWDIDPQMLGTLVAPWLSGWPGRLHDRNAVAAAADVDVPPWTANHLHPRVHTEWNWQPFDLLRATGRL